MQNYSFSVQHRSFLMRRAGFTFKEQPVNIIRRPVFDILALLLDVQIW